MSGDGDSAPSCDCARSAATAAATPVARSAGCPTRPGRRPAPPGTTSRPSTEPRSARSARSAATPGTRSTSRPRSPATARTASAPPRPAVTAPTTTPARVARTLRNWWSPPGAPRHPRRATRCSSVPATSPTRAPATAPPRRARQHPGDGLHPRRQRLRQRDGIGVQHCYGPTWGQFKGRTRPAIGNHEYQSRAPAGTDYFGTRPGRGKGWYSYDAGSWHGWCSMPTAPGRLARRRSGGCGPTSPPSNQCTVASGTSPFRVQSTNHAELGPFWEALYDYGAELVLSGHAHVYERFAPQRRPAAPTPAGVCAARRRDGWRRPLRLRHHPAQQPGA